MLDCFSPIFKAFLSNYNHYKKIEILFFTCWIYITSEFMSVFIGYDKCDQ